MNLLLGNWPWNPGDALGGWWEPPAGCRAALDLASAAAKPGPRKLTPQ
jgi:hypothetical protein